MGVGEISKIFKAVGLDRLSTSSTSAFHLKPIEGRFEQWLTDFDLA
jgi:hypothetical protein